MGSFFSSEPAQNKTNALIAGTPVGISEGQSDGQAGGRRRRKKKSQTAKRRKRSKRDNH